MKTWSISMFRQGLLACLAWGGLILSTASAQMAHVTTPATRANHSFTEQMGIGFGFGFHGGGLPGGNGGRSSVVGLNPFGQFTPNLQFQQGVVGHGNGGMFGFGSHGGAGGFSLNFFGGQSATSSIVSQSSSVTVLNGAPGYFFHGQVRPFVAGVIPVVGGFRGYAPRPQSVLQERLWRLRTEAPASRTAAKRAALRTNSSTNANKSPAPAIPLSRSPEHDDAPLVLKK